MIVQDLGDMPYHQAWEEQNRALATVADGGEQRLFLVEHPPTITFGRRGNVGQNLLISEEQLASRGVDVVHSDRGGDVTFHGPGQLVCYPIIRLNDQHLSVGGYVHRLEAVVIQTLSHFGIEAHTDGSAVGVWVGEATAAAKICAIGVRIRRGVTQHGLALNVSNSLAYVDLIVPCGLAGRPVTSIAKLMGEHGPAMPEVKAVLIRTFREMFTG